MGAAYILKDSLRTKLKKPLGELIRGTPEETTKKLKDIILREKPSRIVSVGDFVSKNLVEHKIYPDISIVDNKVKREYIKPVQINAASEICVKNPPGTLTYEALKAVQEAFKANCRVKIIVDGEEDLLTLAAVFYAPENILIVYGQPNEGIVVVKTSEKNKAEVAKTLKVMERAAKG
jgi:uncharacterized protein (UPF0218 family)